MAKLIQLFPNSRGESLSCKIDVDCGEYAKLTAYGLCPGVCIQVYEQHQDHCRCIDEMRPYCLGGEQIGMDANCTQAIIPMPGCFVAHMCVDEGVSEDALNDVKIFAEKGCDLANVQTVLMGVSI